jgi:hypothetical protein
MALGFLAGLLTACGPGTVSVTTSPSAEAVATATATVTARVTFATGEHEYDLVCGRVRRRECERRAREFVADFVDDPPPDRVVPAGVTIVSISFPLPGTIDATLSNGLHITWDYH